MEKRKSDETHKWCENYYWVTIKVTISSYQSLWTARKEASLQEHQTNKQANKQTNTQMVGKLLLGHH